MTAQPMTLRLLGFFCFLVLPLAVYAPKGEVILLGLVGLTLLARQIADKQMSHLIRNPLAILLGLTLVWSLASSLWTLKVDVTLKTAVSVGLLFVAIVIANTALRQLPPKDRNRLGLWGVRGLWLALALLLIELLFDMPIARLFRGNPGELPPSPQTIFNASLGMIAIVVWPATVWLWQQGNRLLAAGTILLTVTVIFLGEGDSAKLALAVTCGIFVLVLVSGRRGVLTLAALITVGIMIAPVLPLKVISTAQISENFPALKHSALHRIKIWEFTAHNIATKPIAGWGLDSSRNIPGGNEIIVGSETYMPLHPHNGVLQVWLELGAVGAVLLIALIGLCLRGLSRMGSLDQAGGTAALLGGLTIICLSFGIWQNWWIASLGLLAMLTGLHTSGKETGSPDTAG